MEEIPQPPMLDPNTETQIPIFVSKRQASLALHFMGLYQDVEDYIANIPEPNGTIARIEWQTASEIERHHPLVIELESVLEFTSSQMDDLFRLASSF